MYTPTAYIHVMTILISNADKYDQVKITRLVHKMALETALHCIPRFGWCKPNGGGDTEIQLVE